MTEVNQPIGFEISISARDDGTIEAAYIYFTHNPVVTTKQVKSDVLLADFDRDGEILRRAVRTGNILLYAWEDGSAHIKAFDVDRMSNVRATGMPFAPRYRVEFAAC